MRRLVLVGLIASILGAQPAGAQDTPVVQRGETVGGRSLAAWEIAWTRWLFGFSSKPLEEQSECLPQRSGAPVRFLIRKLSDDHVTTVTCTVPAGTYLMLGEPLVYCTDVDPDPGFPTTPRGLRRCARYFYRQLADRSPRVVLDGQPIPNGVVVRPRVFRYRQPGSDVAGHMGAVGRVVILKPLPPGRHTLIHGFRYTDDSNAVTVYKLTVV